MRVVFILSLIWPFLELALGADKYIDGEGYFYSKDTDSASFVREQLRYSAFKNVIGKGLKLSGLDSKLFWSRYQEKFEVWFAPVKEKLDQRLKSKKINAQEYRETLRSKKLSSMVKFGRIERAIKSYVEKRYSHSTSRPKSRYLKISAALDKRSLGKLYMEIVSFNEERVFEKIYLMADIQKVGVGHKSLELEIAGAFSDTVLQHWEKWLRENFQGVVKEFEIVSQSDYQSFQNYIRARNKSEQEIVSPVEIIRTDGERNGRFLPPQYANSLWLSLNIRVAYLPRAKQYDLRSFAFSGGIILIDPKTQKIVFQADIPEEKQQYNISNWEKFNSDIASTIWKLPIEEFKKLREKATSFPMEVKKVSLKIAQIKSIAEVFQFNNLLAFKGLGQSFSPRLLRYRGTKGIVQLEYRGPAKKMISTLLNLDRQKIEGGSFVFLVSKDNPFSFVLKQGG